MNLYNKILLAAAACLLGANSAQAVTVTIEDAEVQTTQLSNNLFTVDLNDQSGTEEFSKTNGNTTYTYSGGLRVTTANQWGGANGSSFITQDQNERSFTMTASQDQKYFGFWWSAGDKYNRIIFKNDGRNVATFVTKDLVDFIDNNTRNSDAYYGNPAYDGDGGHKNEPFSYVNVFFDENEAYDEVIIETLTGSGAKFESDNHTFSTSVQPIRGKQVPIAVNTELVLSVDVSTSVDHGEFELQRDGYVEAFQSEEVQQAIKDLGQDGMAVTMQFWASDAVVDIGWFRLVDDGNGGIAGLQEFIDAMDDVKRNGNTRANGTWYPENKRKKITIDGSNITNNNGLYMGGGTDIKMAIDQARNLILNNNYQGDRLVIDISGDGIPDDTPYAEATATADYGYKNGECGYTLNCPPVVSARDAAIASGITINGLPINADSPGSKEISDTLSVSKYQDQIDTYYGSQIVGGTNSFTMLADGFDDFARAATLKIAKEISNDETCNEDDGCQPPIPTPEPPLPDPDNLDLDFNGILDKDELPGDVDGDGIVNKLDLDDDGDNIADVMELHLPSAISDTGVAARVVPGSATSETVSLPIAPATNITDAQAIDSDGDGTPDYQDEDSDNDYISDKDEAGDTSLVTDADDSDNDGTRNFIDGDSDNDYIPDWYESGKDATDDLSVLPVNTDETFAGGDNIPDYLDNDSDADFISDKDESGKDATDALDDYPVNSYGDDNPDYIDTDSDDDNISDKDEAGDTDLATAPANTDLNFTDGDDQPDYLDLDSDADNISDEDEAGDADLATAPYNSDNTNDASYSNSTTPSGLAAYNDNIPDFLDLDSDDNGILDADEIAGSTFDNDEVDNYRDLDDDGDGIADVIEIGDTPSSPTNSDGVLSDGYDYQDTNSEDDRLKDSQEGVTTETGDGITPITITSPTGSTSGTVNLKNSSEGAITGSDDNTITVVSGENGKVTITGTAEGFDYQEGTVAD